MKRLFRILFLGLFLPTCTPAASNEAAADSSLPDPLSAGLVTDTVGATIAQRFSPPAGYLRTPAPAGSFAAYLRNLPLKAPGAPVRYFDGAIKRPSGVHVAVVDLDIGSRDLQQCADAVIRLRAEYLWTTGAFDRISFHFTNGFRADYPRWRAGERIRVEGNQVNWYPGGAGSTTYATFRKYLDMVFAYAGTWSLQQELSATDWEELAPGDVLVEGGSPGHAVIVVDVAVHPESGEKLYLLGQSYMPAQDIHILQNPADPELSPWYAAAAPGPVRTPEWAFRRSHLRRFRDP